MERTLKSEFMMIDGIRLQWLDWGGKGPTLLFLAGYANTPHIFDGLARRLTDRCHVLGLTRRAHGQSDQPIDGYDIPRLAEDVIGLLDHLNIDKAVLVGHSFAGHEMCQAAAAHPDRILKLVFLDALYDMTDEDAALFAENPLPPAEPPPASFPSVEAYCQDFVERYPTYRRLRSPAWDAQWARTLERTPDGQYRERIRPETARKLMEGRDAFTPDYRAIHCPVLAFYAFQDESWSLPENATDELRREMREHIQAVNERYKRRCLERARREFETIRVVEYEDTSHYCFLDRESDVLEVMREFL